MMRRGARAGGRGRRRPGAARGARTRSTWCAGSWRYGDPGREIARRLGAAPKETVGTPYGGNFSQACVIDAAREIQAGRRGVVLVAGAENGRSAGQAQRQGVALRETEAPGAPDRKVAEDKAIFHDAELARGMNSASDVFAVIESAIRFARGETPRGPRGAHRRAVGGLQRGRLRQPQRLDPQALHGARRSAAPRPTTR